LKLACYGLIGGAGGWSFGRGYIFLLAIV